MSFLSLATVNPSYIDNVARHPVRENLVRTGGVVGGAYLAGRINTQYGDRAKWKGMDVTYVAGLAGKAVTMAADWFGLGGGGYAYAAVDSLSTGLLAAHFCAKGAADGLEAAKGATAAPKQLPAASSSSTALPAAKPATTALGAIPPAPEPGKYLDLKRVAAIAAM